MITLREVSLADFESIRDALATLLRDAVGAGASVGFLAPLETDAALAWVDSLRTAIGTGERLLWVAEDGGQVCGTVQLELCGRANGSNRAEVQKLLVHSAARRAGIGRSLMQALEARARERERGLLYLDTEAGSPAEVFYRALGYTAVGEIPEFACSPSGEWRATALYYKTLFTRKRP